MQFLLKCRVHVAFFVHVLGFLCLFCICMVCDCTCVCVCVRAHCVRVSFCAGLPIHGKHLGQPQTFKHVLLHTPPPGDADASSCHGRYGYNRQGAKALLV